jgi:hypothetical protein
MVIFFTACGCRTRTDIVREHLEDTLRICDVSAMGLYQYNSEEKNKWWFAIWFTNTAIDSNITPNPICKILYNVT